MTFRSISEVLASLDDDALETLRNTVEDEIRHRDYGIEEVGELGAEWPMPADLTSLDIEDRTPRAAASYGLSALVTLLTRGAENG